MKNAPEFVHDFETFGDNGLSQLLEAAQRFAADIWQGRAEVVYRRGEHHSKPGRWLTLLGNNGNGKTHLIKRLFRYARRHCEAFRCPVTTAVLGRSCVYRDWRKLLPEIYEGSFGQLENHRKAWLVAIDDLWAAPDRSALGESIINALATREDKWTLITSNKSLEWIGQHDKRLATRMNRYGEVVQIDTTDFSLRKEKV